jgi:hypothetical protein
VTTTRIRVPTRSGLRISGFNDTFRRALRLT